VHINLLGGTNPNPTNSGIQFTHQNNLTGSSGSGTMNFLDGKAFITTGFFNTFLFVPGRGDWKMRFSYPPSQRGASVTFLAMLYFQDDYRNAPV